jgi:hypothetical protein
MAVYLTTPLKLEKPSRVLASNRIAPGHPADSRCIAEIRDWIAPSTLESRTSGEDEHGQSGQTSPADTGPCHVLETFGAKKLPSFQDHREAWGS